MRLRGSVFCAATFVGAVVLVGSLAAERSLAQSPPPAAKDPFEIEFKLDDSAFLYYLLDEQSEQPGAGADGDKLRSELKALEASLEEKLRDTQKIKAQIEQMRSKLKSVVQSKEFKSGTGTIQLMLDTGDGKQTPHEITLRNVNGVWTIVSNEKAGEKVVGKVVTTTGNPSVTATPAVTGTVVVEPKGVVEYRVNPTAKPGAGAQPPSADANQRIDNLEKKLDKLMNVLEQMRKEMEGSGKKSGAEADKNAENMRVAEALKRALAEKDAALKHAADERDRDLKRALEEREKERKRAADERAIEQKRAAEERAIAEQQRAADQKRDAFQRQAEIQRAEEDKKAEKVLRERERAIEAELKKVEELKRLIEDAKKEKADSKKSGAKEPKEPKQPEQGR